MRKYIIIALGLLVTACNSNNDVESKKKLLEKYKKEVAELESKISQLEIELSDNLENTEFLVSVGLDTIQFTNFESKSSFQAVVESEQDVTLSAEMGGVVSQIFVKEGQSVSKGQILVQLDASLVQSQLAEIQNALDLAETVYRKQKRLHEQNIGTEIQFIEAKNRYEALQRQSNSAMVQLSKFSIKAPFAGKVDNISVVVGSLTAPGHPIVKVVDNSNIKIVAQAPESYIGTVKVGDKVEIKYPSLNQTMFETVDAVSESINNDNRTFNIYIRPQSKDVVLKPNLLAIVYATNFKADSVITVPTQVIKHSSADETFVYVIKSSGDDKIVERRYVEVGKYNANRSIINSGLESGDLIIVNGYNSVDEGDKVKITD